MHKITKKMVLLLVCLLTGCASVKSNDEEKQNDKDRVIKTAKINAQLGIAYLERHDLKRAKQKLLTSLQQAPGIPEPWYSMGYFLEATGNKAMAKNYYMKAVEVAPNRGDAHNNYGTFLCRMGEFRESIKEFQLAIADPDYLDPASAYENAGTCARQIPDNKLAMFYFNRATEQDPSRSASLFNLAELYLNSGDYKKARMMLNTYEMANPPTKQTEKFRVEIETKLAQSLDQHKEKVLAADLDKARTYKQVVSVTKQHGITMTHDPLLPFAPEKGKIKPHALPAVVMAEPLKIIPPKAIVVRKPAVLMGAKKPAAIVAAKKSTAPKHAESKLEVGMVKSLRDYPNSKPFQPSKIAVKKQPEHTKLATKKSVATKLIAQKSSKGSAEG